VARAVHRLSPRRYNPMWWCIAAPLTETLIESELFGHERRFTGAQYRIEAIRSGHGGTVFLDEIATSASRRRPTCCASCRSAEIVRVGGTQSIHVDFRVIAAQTAIDRDRERGRFSSDLYYRLNVFTIQLPPCATATATCPCGPPFHG